MLKNSDELSNTIRSIVPLMVRFAVYTAIIFVFVLLLLQVVKAHGAKFFYENGPIEWFEFATLIVAATIFAVAAWRDKERTSLYALLASLPAFAAVRELDNVFDDLLPIISWRIGFVFIIFAGVLIWRNWRQFLLQAIAFARSPAFMQLWAGFIIAIPFAQLVGHGPIFKFLVAKEYIRDIKRFFEETTEAFGYLMICFGAIEVLLLKPVAVKEDG